MKKLSIALALLFLSCNLLFSQEEIRQNVYFDFNSSAIRPTEGKKLDSLAMALSYRSGYQVQLIGHTDNVGSDGYNDSLSVARTTTIYNELLKRRVDQARIDTSSLGEKKPIATNTSEDHRARNRRVEILVTIFEGTNHIVEVTPSIGEGPDVKHMVSGQPQTITLPSSGPASAGGYGFNIITNTAQMQALNLTTQTVGGEPLMSNSMFCITSTPADTTNPLPVVVLIPATGNPFCRFPDVLFFDSQVDSTDENQVKWMPLMFPDLKAVTINGVNYFEWTIAPRTPGGRCKNADCRSNAPSKSANIILNSKRLEIVSLSVIYPDANALLRGKVVEKNLWEFKYFGNDSLTSPYIKVVVKDKNGQLRTADVIMRDLKQNKKGEYILKKKMFVKRES